MSGVAVYIILPAGDDGPCKVGISRDPWDRLLSLQTGSPVPLRLGEIYYLRDRATAARLEQSFHAAFAERRLHGEWFAVTFDEANYWLFGREIVPDAMARGFM